MTIGVFDSGLGGLSVLRHLKQQLKQESFLYVADSANAPYGDKDDHYIQQRCLQISDFIFSHQVSAIVVACNTATAAAVEMIRERLDVPVVAIEPGLKPACLATSSGKIGVLATASTLQSSAYKKLLKRYLTDVCCYEQAADGLVEQVESGLLDTVDTRELLQKYLQPMLNNGVDTVVLGCTHYPFLMPLIKDVVGNNVKIIDTGAAVAEQLKNVLNKQTNSCAENEPPIDRYFSSANKQYSEQMIARLLGTAVKVEALKF